MKKYVQRDIDALHASLEKLSKEQQVLFCVHIVRRLELNYLDFMIREDFGDERIIRDIIEFAKKGFDYPFDNSVQFDHLVDRIDEATPDGDDFGSVYGTYARDACFTAHYLLILILENYDKATTYVSKCAFNTVDINIIDVYSQSSGDELTEEQLMSHAQMQNEINFQIQLLDNLCTEKEFSILLNRAFKTPYNQIIKL